MKITITREFNTLEEATDFLIEQMREPSRVRINTTEGVEPALPAETRLGGRPETGRKPRSDAGKPRGPYGKAKKVKTPAAEAPAVTETPERSEPAVEEAPAIIEPAAPASATASAKAESATPDAAALTIDHVKAEMAKLARKHGIEANMKLLAKFGTMQVSKLDPGQYAAFAEAVKAATASTVAP